MKHGDKRKDGRIFWGVQKRSNGVLRENWVTPATWRNNQRLIKKHNKLRVTRIKNSPVLRSKYAAQLRVWVKDNPSRVILYKARERAKEYGVPFALLPNDIVIPTHCPVLGIRLRRGSKSVTKASPSLDRIIPRLGYVPNNVVVVSHFANSIKRDATPEQLMLVARFYAKLQRANDKTS